MTEMTEAAAPAAPDGASLGAMRALTLDRLLLPVIKLKGAAHSKQLEQRFNYLWSAAHALLTSNATLAHSMTASIVAMARQHRMELPASVLDYLCEQCGGLLVPSVSADVRVVTQHHKTPANRKLARQQRRLVQPHAPLRRELLRNVVQVTCHRCRHVHRRPGASVVHRPLAKTTKRPREDAAAAAPLETKRAKTDGSDGGDNAGAASAAGAASSASVVHTAPAPAPPMPPSIFAAPPSPPRKLLDGPKKKKKKPQKSDVAAIAVKSSLNSFLQTLRPTGSGGSKK